MNAAWPPDGLSGYADEVKRTDRIEICLDFDGTLVPIETDPDAVELGEGTRTLLARLAARPAVSVSIISGRALSDLRSRVGVEQVDYAGNHGLELEQNGERWRHPGVREVRPALERVAAQLEEALGSLPGVRIEDKFATLTVHYRSAPGDAISDVQQTATEVISQTDQLRCKPGRAVVQIRPAFEWNKGDALRLLSDAGETTLTMYAGDDRTDVDGFDGLSELPGTTFAVGVGEESLPADIHLSGPSEVHTMLEWLLDLRADTESHDPARRGE